MSKENEVVEKKDRIETKGAIETLPVMLTIEEHLDRSQKLAKANQDGVEIEAKKKDIVADFAAQLKKIEATLGALSRIVASGKEYRDVKCQWTYNYTQGFKELRRLDTMEVVKHQELTQQERQGSVI
jgi:hypothetical protein